MTIGATGRATHRAAGEASVLDSMDVLLLAFLAGLAVLAVRYREAPLLVPIVLLGATIVVVATWAHHTERVRVVHDFFPVAAVIAIFELLGAVIPAVNRVRWDATFAVLDARLFGTLAASWFGALGRPSWLTDLASIAYVAYYPLPVVLAAALYHRHRESFRAFALTVVATFLVSYVGYLLFPTLGPRTTDASVLGGGAVAAAVRAFIRVVEGNPLDAFPSGHVAVALVCAGLGWRAFPRWRVPLALVVGGIAFATVYLSYHYVVDVVAGAALGSAMLVLHARRQRPAAHTVQRPRSHAMRSNRPAR